MKRYITLVAAVITACGFTVRANYVTKGDGSVHTFATLSQTEGSGVTKMDDGYHVTDDIVIAATDTLRINDNDMVRLGDRVLIKIRGYADFEAPTFAAFAITSETAKPMGFYFDGADASGVFRNIYLQHSGILTEGNTKGIVVDHCIISKYNGLLSTDGIISINSSSSDNVVSNCSFFFFDKTAIFGTSPAGVTVNNCYFSAYGTEDNQFPLISLSSGGDNKVIIEENLLYCNSYCSSGVTISNDAEIDGENEVIVKNNKVYYGGNGIIVKGNVNALIKNNTLIDNRYASDRSSGGYGILLSDSKKLLTATVTGNYVEGSLHGIAIEGCENVNLGTTEKPGENVFVNNGCDGKVCDLYNNSGNTVYAQGNMWNVSEQTPEEIAKVITDKNDNAVLGEVICDNPKIGIVRTEPNTVMAKTTYDKVELSWQSPTAPFDLKWHDGALQYGTSGRAKERGLNDVIAAARFTPDDLANYANKVIDAIEYYEYNDPFEAYVQIYEDGNLVRNQKVDLSGYQRDTWRNTKLDEPYVISGDKEIIVALKVVYAGNRTWMIVLDQSPTIGKGNLISYNNGKTWETWPIGDFLLTAHIRNISNSDPDGYVVKNENGEALTSEGFNDTSFTIDRNTDGEHTYYVQAIYKMGDDELLRTSKINATTSAVTSLVPPPGYLQGYIHGNSKGLFEWSEPLKRGDEMTWSNKQYAGSVGGRGSSPALWLRQRFSANDLIAFPNHQITAINAYFTEAKPTTMKIFVTKNGKIDYYRDVTDEELAAISLGDWTKFNLEAPYKLELGNDYEFGYYCTHESGMKIVGVDNGEEVLNKGDLVATTKLAENFEDTKLGALPVSYYGCKGNIMITADVEALGDLEPLDNIVGYDLYVNGNLVAENVTERSYICAPQELGYYYFSVVAKGKSGKVSPSIAYNNMQMGLPENYFAPFLMSTNYDPESGKVDIEWSNEISRLIKCNEQTAYTIYYDTDMDYCAGQMFTAEELNEIKGYEIYSIEYGIGSTEADNVSLEIYADSECLFSYDITSDSPYYLHTLTLDEPIAIPEGKNLYIVYNIKCAAGVDALVTDNGPYVEGGAVVSFDHGQTWIKFGEFDEEAADVNVFVKAMARAQGSAPATSEAGVCLNELAENKTVTLEHHFNENGGIEATESIRKPLSETSGVQRQPDVEKCIVYCNSNPIAETTASSFSEIIKKKGEYSYTVSSIFTNGWESHRTEAFNVVNHIAQKPEAPYNLRGEATGDILTLTWEAFDADAAVLKYHNGTMNDAVAVGRYGCSYAISIKADSLAKMAKIGEQITHVKFYLASTDVTECYALVEVGENVLRSQTVNVSDLVQGWNVIRLDEPFEIKPEYADVKVGCFLKHDTSIKPMGVDNGPAIVGLGDLYLSSVHFGSLATDQGIDANLMIEGIFQKGTQVLMAPAQGQEEETQATTYSIYRDGTLVASGITNMSYIIDKASDGAYTVTATLDGVESAESNIVQFAAGGTGVAANKVAQIVRYDRNADKLILTEADDAQIFTVAGTLVNDAKAASSIDMSDLASGTYIVKTAGAVIKVVK